jgi:putative protease
MSAKDLCTIDFLNKIIESGVSVLKIEGRGRSADYVNITTSCYREAIDSIQEGSYSSEKVTVWKERLATVFNRGFWDGYYLGKLMGEWNDSYGSKATTRKVYVAKGRKYYEEAKVGEFLMEAQDLKMGDKICITGPTTGVIFTKIEELRIDNKPVIQVKKGTEFTFVVPKKIRPSDKLYKIVEA